MALSTDQFEPIFILSCERSGSTLLRMIVDTHPDIACPGQLSLGPTCAHLFHTIYFSIGQRVDVPESERAALVRGEVRDIVDNVMKRYATSRDKQIWCEKTTLNVDYLQILSEVFPNARYLCLYRNCMDVVQSCLKFSALGFMRELAPYVRDNPHNLVAAIAESWLDKNTKILDFEASHRSQCFRVSYEDLTLHPHTTIEGIFHFVGVSWDPRMLDSIFSTEHDRGEGDLKVHFSKEISRESVGKGRSIPSRSVPAQMQVRVNILNKRLGFGSFDDYYEISNSDDGATKPPCADVDSFFRSQAPHLIAERRATMIGLRGVCHFVVEGIAGGSWLLDLSGVDSVVRKEEHPCRPTDCTIAIGHSALCELIQRTASVGEIYERGQATVHGSEHMALQFAMLLFG